MGPKREVYKVIGCGRSKQSGDGTLEELNCLIRVSEDSADGSQSDEKFAPRRDETSLVDLRKRRKQGKKTLEGKESA